MNLTNAEGFFEAGGYDYIRFEQSDLHGLSRSKTVPVRHFRRFAENGLNFFGGLLGLDAQGGVAPGTGYMEERRFADQVLWPDPRTLSPIPWLDRTARVLAEPSWYDGTPVQAGPRFILRSLVNQLVEMGYTIRGGIEYEFYLVDRETREPVFPGIQIFWSARNDFDPSFTIPLLDSLSAAGVDVITSNAEYGPGQMEINFSPAVGVNAADQAFTFKNALKEIALKHGYIASFMTKPYGDASASGCHFHQSLLDRRRGANVFYDEGSPDGISQVARHWIGGQIRHAAALTAICAPTVNCAKRFKLNSFAPMNATWGFEDRTAAIRVKGARHAETHVENRIPCAGSNPYLVAAAIIAAGIDGLVNEIEPPAPTATTAYADTAAATLPTTLDESLAAFEADSALQSYFGAEFVQLYLAVKRHEIEKARAAIPSYGTPEWNGEVTEWERDNLFEYL